MDDALASRRRAVELFPDDLAYHSDLLATLHYHPGYTPDQLFQEHLAWAARHAEPLTRAAPPPSNDRSPDRPLRVGYVSAQFREYPAPRFFGPLLRHHDRRRFAVYCYNDARRGDAVTKRLKAAAVRSPRDGWRDIFPFPDAAVADLVRRDGIDVLVDLGGHMDCRRLGVFARRPAPVQVAYVNYPDTTGMTALHYRLTDAWHDPPGETDRYHTEKLVRLGRCCWAYDPWDVPAVTELPALSAGRVTFGAFNRLIKLTPPMAKVWARILDAVPGSVLAVLGTPDGRPETTARRLAGYGIDTRRVRICPPRPRLAYLSLVAQADIILDTFPYAGMTTTCDALWMGVPPVTLAGRTHVSRVGVSLLNAVGLPELIAHTEDEYVETAVGLATDLPRLADLRRGLRARAQNGPLGDGAGLTRAVEAAFRDMWRAWCAAPAGA